MATTTTNLALIKPAGTDKIRIAQINSNMDTLDAKIGPVGNTPLQTQVSALQTIIDAFPGEIGIVVNGNKTASGVTASSGQYVILINSTITGKADGLYTAAKAIPANTALDGTYLTAVSGGGLNDVVDSIPAKSFRPRTTIASNASLNDLLTYGIHQIPTVDIGNTVTDLPDGAAKAGTVVVLPGRTVSQRKQIYLPYNSNTQYTRTMTSDGVWTNWWRTGDIFYVGNIGSTSAHATTTLTLNEARTHVIIIYPDRAQNSSFGLYLARPYFDSSNYANNAAVVAPVLESSAVEALTLTPSTTEASAALTFTNAVQRMYAKVYAI